MTDIGYPKTTGVRVFGSAVEKWVLSLKASEQGFSSFRSADFGALNLEKPSHMAKIWQKKIDLP